MTKRLPVRHATCEECGAEFILNVKTRRFCSLACRERSWSKRNPGYMVEAQRRYVAKHADRKRQYMDEYRQRPAAQERARELVIARYQANPERFKARSKARRDSYVHIHTRADWQAKRDEWGCCAYCGATDKPLTRDHVIPISQGDPNTVDLISNIVPACRRCNSRKARIEALLRGKPWATDVEYISRLLSERQRAA